MVKVRTDNKSRTRKMNVIIMAVYMQRGTSLHYTVFPDAAGIYGSAHNITQMKNFLLK